LGDELGTESSATITTDTVLAGALSISVETYLYIHIWYIKTASANVLRYRRVKVADLSVDTEQTVTLTGTTIRFIWAGSRDIHGVSAASTVLLHITKSSAPHNLYSYTAAGNSLTQRVDSATPNAYVTLGFDCELDAQDVVTFVMEDRLWLCTDEDVDDIVVDLPGVALSAHSDLAPLVCGRKILLPTTWGLSSPTYIAEDTEIGVDLTVGYYIQARPPVYWPLSETDTQVLGQVPSTTLLAYVGQSAEEATKLCLICATSGLQASWTVSSPGTFRCCAAEVLCTSTHYYMLAFASLGTDLITHTYDDQLLLLSGPSTTLIQPYNSSSYEHWLDLGRLLIAQSETSPYPVTGIWSIMSIHWDQALVNLQCKSILFSQKEEIIDPIDGDFLPSDTLTWSILQSQAFYPGTITASDTEQEVQMTALPISHVFSWAQAVDGYLLQIRPTGEVDYGDPGEDTKALTAETTLSHSVTQQLLSVQRVRAYGAYVAGTQLTCLVESDGGTDSSVYIVVAPWITSQTDLETYATGLLSQASMATLTCQIALDETLAIGNPLSTPANLDAGYCASARTWYVRSCRHDLITEITYLTCTSGYQVVPQSTLQQQITDVGYQAMTLGNISGPYLLVTGSGNQTIASGAGAGTFENLRTGDGCTLTTQHDDLGGWDASTGVLTVARAGTYHCECQILMDSSGTIGTGLRTFRCKQQRSGGNINDYTDSRAAFYTTAAYNYWTIKCFFCAVEVGDEISFDYRQNAGADRYIGINRLCIMRSGN
jgi:hypothetical protein